MACSNTVLDTALCLLADTDPSHGQPHAIQSLDRRIAYTLLYTNVLFNATREGDIVQKNVIVSQKRHAQGRPLLSLSYVDMYNAANSRY
jgi:hypothetical protein